MTPGEPHPTVDPCLRTTMPGSGGSNPFAEALSTDMETACDSVRTLHVFIIGEGGVIHISNLRHWLRGSRSPRSSSSFHILDLIGRRYSKPDGYYSQFLPHRGRATTFKRTRGAPYSNAHRKRISWHLPNDFDQRTDQDRASILSWVDQNVLTAGTEFQTYMRKVRTKPSSMIIPLGGRLASLRAAGSRKALIAPEGLTLDVAQLTTFKTSALAPLGALRLSVWSLPTTSFKVCQIGLVFGALWRRHLESRDDAAQIWRDLSLRQLTFPSVWEAYLSWQHDRRGFYTSRETDILRTVLSLTQPDHGWLSAPSTPPRPLGPMGDLIRPADAAIALADWPLHCRRFQAYARQRVRDLASLSIKHRDPSHALQPVLDADSPLLEYSKIAAAVHAAIPTRRFPVARAEALRDFLLIRLAMRAGLRQRNMRELLLSAQPGTTRTLSELERRRRGEIRQTVQGTWEIFIPARAFKNADSRFFRGQPLLLTLNDHAGLYEALSEYVTEGRKTLIGPRDDAGSFFVTSPCSCRASIEYTNSSFYQCWRQIIERFGIYNPYTGRGAIKGLLPHGPHAIRDVIATHVLKRTGSFDRASYAIHVAPATVQKHYARFLPTAKAGSVADLLEEPFSGHRLDAYSDGMRGT